MILIVGLGNPGQEYVATRHNFGFMVVDAIASSYGVGFHLQEKFKAEIAEVRELGGRVEKVLLAKPQTYMNLSGESVGALARYYKIAPQDIWVVADDLDLPLGKIRVRHGGDSAGHHGIDSIIAALGTKEFGRIRLGIRGDELRSEQLSQPLEGRTFVLSPFPKAGQQYVARTIDQVVATVRESLTSGQLTAHTYEIDGFDDRLASQA